VDIIIEGKITPDEGMAEVLQTVIDLRNLANPILRVTADNHDLQGRISFSRGHILGGRVNNTDEIGYPAIRKLFSITTGNYAILDPGRSHVNDVNQSLWIEADKLIAMLPNLPEHPDTLIEGHPDDISINRQKFDAMDLRVGSPGNEKPVSGMKSKARSFNRDTWFFVQLSMWMLGTLILVALIIGYWTPIYEHLKPLLVK
jgi:hypothetical protein